MRETLLAKIPTLAKSRLLPSGSAVLTALAAITPAPPGLLSMTTLVPPASPIFWAITRSAKSVLAPAAKGETTVIGRFDNAWAGADDPPKACTAQISVIADVLAMRLAGIDRLR